MPFTIDSLPKLTSFILDAPLDIINAILAIGAPLDVFVPPRPYRRMYTQPGTDFQDVWDQALWELARPGMEYTSNTIPTALLLLCKLRARNSKVDTENHTRDVWVAVAIAVAAKFFDFNVHDYCMTPWSTIIGTPNSKLFAAECALLKANCAHFWKELNIFVSCFAPIQRARMRMLC